MKRTSHLALDKDAVYRAAETMAARGLRVLAMACRHVDAQHAKLEHVHVAGALTFLGLQGMMDPPRPEAIASVRECQRAGITYAPVMNKSAPVDAEAWLRIVGVAAVAFVAVEFEKRIRFGWGRGKAAITE